MLSELLGLKSLGERRGAGINLAFLCPLTPFRDYVMGAASGERAATAEETTGIQALLREAVAAGAVGKQVAEQLGNTPAVCHTSSGKLWLKRFRRPKASGNKLSAGQRRRSVT